MLTVTRSWNKALHNTLQVTRRLPELLLFLISACAAAGIKCERSTAEVVTTYCSSLYSAGTRMLAKCALCSLARFQAINQKDFELSHSEIELFHSLLFSAAKDDEGDSNVWYIYTLTTGHYLHFLLLLGYRFALSEHNAELFAKTIFDQSTIFETLNVVFEFHTEVDVLNNALLFLEAMIRNAKLQAISPELILVIKRIFFSSRSSDLQLSAYFCMLSLGLEAEVPYDTGKMCVIRDKHLTTF